MKLEEMVQLDMKRRKDWHRQLLQNNREKAIKVIKTQLPNGVNLEEYLKILDAEISASKSNKLF